MPMIPVSPVRRSGHAGRVFAVIAADYVGATGPAARLGRTAGPPRSTPPPRALWAGRAAASSPPSRAARRDPGSRSIPVIEEGIVLATVPSASLLGVDGHPVVVEVHVSSGLPGFTIVGSPDAVCREARDRVRAAL